MRTFLLVLGACVLGACATEPGVCLAERGRHVGGDSFVYDVAWSPVDDLLVTGGAQTLRLLSVRDGGRRLRVLDEQPNGHRFNSVLWSPDGGHVVAPTGYAVRLYAVDRAAGALVPVAQVRTEGEQQRGMLSPDGSRLLTCDVQGRVEVFAVSWDPPELVPLAGVQAHEGPCTRVAWSPSGARAASAGHDGTVPVYDVDPQTGGLTEVHRIEAPEEAGEVLWTSAEDRLLVGTFGERNLLWLVGLGPDGPTVLQAVADHESGVGALSLDAAGARLVTGDHNHTVRVYALDDRLSLRTALPADGLGVHAARLSRDDTLLARTVSQFVDETVVMEVGACAASSP